MDNISIVILFTDSVWTFLIKPSNWVRFDWKNWKYGYIVTTPNTTYLEELIMNALILKEPNRER